MSKRVTLIKQGFKKDKKALLLVNMIAVISLGLTFMFAEAGLLIPTLLFASVSGGVFGGWNGLLIREWF